MSKFHLPALPSKPLSWDDVRSITGWLLDVPIADIEQGQLIHDYDFGSADMRSCGREGCRQVHGHGWIVGLL